MMCITLALWIGLAAAVKVGGVGETHAATVQVQQLVEQLRPEIEAKLQKEGQQVEQFVATEYQTQVVAGLNYFVKVQVSAQEFIFVRIYQDFTPQHKVFLHGIQVHKGLGDPLAYFEPTEP